MLIPTVLLVEDDVVQAEAYKAYLRYEPINLKHVTTGIEVQDFLQQTIPNVIILDLMLPDMNGMEILKDISQYSLACAVIIISSKTAVDIGKEARQYGTFDYIEKPFKAERLKLALHNALHQQDLSEKLDNFQQLSRSEYHGFIGASQPMQSLYQLIDLVATTDASILISGETGTGKELCAKAIHNQSKRSDKPFVALNCGTMSKDLIESRLFGHVYLVTTRRRGNAVMTRQRHEFSYAR
jgi:DNA-binding NtrC family response regulator